MAMEGTGIVPVMDVNNHNNGYGDGFGWGGGGAWIAWIIVLFALMSGWGNGWNNRGNGLAEGQILQEINSQGNATRDAVRQSFDTSVLESGIRGVQNGLCDGFYAVNNSIKDTQGIIQQGICGLEKTVMQGDYNLGAAIAENRFAAQQCCCQTERAIDAVRYENARNTGEIINVTNRNIDALRFDGAQNTHAIVDAENCGTQRILDKLCAMEANAKDQQIAALSAQLQTANFRLSQQEQNAYIVNTISPRSIPAYPTCSPYQATNGYGNYGCNNGCGCV